MVDLDFRERERQARQRLADRLKRLRATLATPEVRRVPPSRREPVRPDMDSERPAFWWQR